MLELLRFPSSLLAALTADPFRYVLADSQSCFSAAASYFYPLQLEVAYARARTVPFLALGSFYN